MALFVGLTDLRPDFYTACTFLSTLFLVTTLETRYFDAQSLAQPLTYVYQKLGG